MHITFVRSVVLDSWSWDQLRRMKVGGNLRASEHFKKYGGGTTNADVKTRYTGKAAALYKEKLAQLISEDAKRSPDVVTYEGAYGLDEVELEKAPDEEDFFSNWDAPKKSAVAQATATPPPVRRVVVAAPQTASKPNLLGTRRPSAGSGISGGTGAGGRPGAGKLGVKKSGVAINFEEAEARAKEEEERAARTGIPIEDPVESNNVNGGGFSSRLGYQDSRSSSGEATKADTDRLGIGMGRMGFGSTSASSTKPAAATKLGFGAMGTPAPNASASSKSDNEYGQFNNQKSISSDQYFKRNQYDPEQSAANQANLTRFEGAKSISSNQYFNRNEGSERSGGAGGGSVDLQYTATEFARKFVDQASNDLSVVKNVASQATAKLNDIISDIQHRYY